MTPLHMFVRGEGGIKSLDAHRSTPLFLCYVTVVPEAFSEVPEASSFSEIGA